MGKSKSICVVIPAYNEEESVGMTIKELRRHVKGKIVVVDDGSEDDTVKISKKIGVRVIEMGRNFGVGSAFRVGVSFALENNCECVVQVDADGQHDPEYLGKLVSIVLEKNADVVIGSRYLKRTSYVTAMERMVGIKILSWLIRMKTGKKIADPTSGYRVYGRRAMKFLIRNYSGKCPEAYMVVKLIKQGYVVLEQKVEMRPRLAGKSSLNLLTGMACFAKNVFAILLV